ncbi:hypothetical protein GCM10008967_25800 [Bacillus carboniphilus]|uniref:G5 domain-containing protein n=2 Tax=Bacillus carboniphilus TaxID=86663 RepID=A0ABN0WDN5_9BACI
MYIKKYTTIFLSILLGTALFVSLFQLSVYAYDKWFNQAFAEQTLIGSVDVSGLTDEEAAQKVRDAVSSWKNDVSFSIQIEEQTILLKNDAFDFDIESSIKQAKDSTINALNVRFLEDHLLLKLTTDASHVSISPKEIEPIIQMMEQKASYLLAQSTSLELKGGDQNQPSTPSHTEYSITIVRTTASPNINKYLNRTALELELEPNHSFSFLNWSEKYGLLDLTNEELSTIASVLWEGVLSTPVSLVERHTSGSLPASIQPGLEAKIDKNNGQDLSFNNSTDVPILFQLRSTGPNTISLTISTEQTSSLVSYSIIQEKVLEPRKVIQYVSNNDSRAGQTLPGQKGYEIKIIREYTDTKGNILQSEVVVKDSYLPIHETIFQVGP